jgi:hypothetical protein
MRYAIAFGLISALAANVVRAQEDAAPQGQTVISVARKPSGPTATIASVEGTLAAAAAATANGKRPSATASSPVATDTLALVHRTPNIVVEMTGPRRVSLGNEATYHFKLKNHETAPLDDLVVFIAVPDWVEVAEARATSGETAAIPGGSSATTAGATYLWKFAKIEARSEHDLALTIVPSKTAPVTVDVRWTYGRPTSLAVIEVQQPKLALGIQGPADVIYGHADKYELRVTNPGTGDAENVVIALLGDGKLAPARYRIGTLKAGETKAVGIEHLASASHGTALEAEATASGALQARARIDVRVHRPQLDVSIVAPRAHYAGADVHCEVRVRNSGDAPARAVQVALRLPTSAKLLKASRDVAPGADSSQVAWPVGELAPGAEQVLLLTCRLNAPGTAAIEASGTAADNLVSAANAAINVMAVADVVLDVKGQPGPIAVGTATTYVIKITNRGASAAGDLQLVASLPDGHELVSIDAASTEVGPGRVAVKTGALASHAEISYHLFAKAAKPGSHQVRVELHSDALKLRLTQELTTLFYGDEEFTTAVFSGDGAKGKASR